MRRMFAQIASGLIVGCLPVAVFAYEDVGPPAGKEVPPLKATVISDQEGAPAQVEPNTDIVKERGEKPTIYVFLPEKNWTDLSLAGFLKGVDGGVQNQADSRVVLVFTTDNPRAATDYLERRAWVFDLANTTMAVHDKAGELEAWNISPTSAVTAIVAKGGKITKTFAFSRPADADATAVLRGLKSPSQPNQTDKKQKK